MDYCDNCNRNLCYGCPHTVEEVEKEEPKHTTKEEFRAMCDVVCENTGGFCSGCPLYENGKSTAPCNREDLTEEDIIANDGWMEKLKEYVGRLKVNGVQSRRKSYR